MTSFADTPRWIPPLGWRGTLIGFGAAGALLALVTRVVIPAVVARTGVEPLAWWFVLGGFGVFLPLALTALLLLRQEALDGTDIWRDRLRFRAMTAEDWRATMMAIIAAGALSVLVQFVLLKAGIVEALRPAYFALEPIGTCQSWLLVVWVPFFVLNVLSEELLWRGVVLPRQEAALGARAWIANAVGWGVFHLAYGVVLLVVLAPILVLLPWLVQRQKNTWVGVCVRAALNAAGFLLVAFGFV